MRLKQYFSTTIYINGRTKDTLYVYNIALLMFIPSNMELHILKNIYICVTVVIFEINMLWMIWRVNYACILLFSFQSFVMGSHNRWLVLRLVNLHFHPLGGDITRETVSTVAAGSIPMFCSSTAHFLSWRKYPARLSHAFNCGRCTAKLDFITIHSGQTHHRITSTRT